MKRRITLLFTAIVLNVNLQGQVVNGYAEVTGIAGASFTLGAVDETGDTFEDGEWVVVMQMQDNVIGTVTNTAAFGSLGLINNAGVYEIRQIASIVETAGVPSTIVLVNSPNFTYNICANCQVQLITFRQYGSPNYTTTANMSARSWDGQLGGVLSFYVDGTLTIAHNLDANLDGFRGAGPNAGGSAGCQGNSNFRVVNQANMADKGESIYKNTTAAYAAGMGRILNGGGGGNSHNGGGGGGGNYTAGGTGGPGWNNCSPSAGGFGGLSLQSSIAVGRVFMGGGGGAGEGNNNLATDGGHGGGIILIKADEITTGTCAGINIQANGENIAFAGNDGGGGGGAAGSIVFEVNTWNVSPSCPLIVEANGGDGGDVNNGGTHGGGGGGGQGVVFYSTSEPTTNVTTNTNNGIGGCSNNSNPCNSQAGSGGGSDGDGVQQLLTGPLPIQLIHFSGEIINRQSELEWITASEYNNDYFTLEHSGDGFSWNQIEKIAGAGSSTSTINYFATHKKPVLGVNYYRLKQTDFNGTYEYSNVISLKYDDNETYVYPNPSTDELFVTKKNIEKYTLQIFNIQGQEITVETESMNDNSKKIKTSKLAAGIYVLSISYNNERELIKFIHND